MSSTVEFVVTHFSNYYTAGLNSVGVLPICVVYCTLTLVDTMYQLIVSVSLVLLTAGAALGKFQAQLCACYQLHHFFVKL